MLPKFGNVRSYSRKEHNKNLDKKGLGLQLLVLYKKRSTGPQKNCFFTPLTIINGFFRWQNREERPNRSSNNGKMAKIAKRPVSDGVTESGDECVTSM